MRERHADEAPADVSLPITPMLDMSFQLMFFFIVTFNPSKEVSRPFPLLDEQSKQAADPAKVDPNAKPKIDKKDDIPIKSKVTVVVEKQTDGFTVTLPPGTSDIYDSTDQGIEKLTRRLKELLDQAGDDRTLTFEARREVKWKDVIRVRDACLDAGFTDIRYTVPSGAGAAGPGGG
jgi:biopolymer transport protein ExbD